LATAAVAFWLWLVIVPARVAILYPEGCECDPAGYYVKCYYLPVNPIPSIHLTGVRVLCLKHNKITVLQRDSFVSLPELKVLDIRECGLRTVELGAFNGLTQLTRLSVSGNGISEILPGTFEDMSSLENFYLSDNKIKHMNSAVFSIGSIERAYKFDTPGNVL
jgi:hypothetical protein